MLLTVATQSQFRPKMSKIIRNIYGSGESRIEEHIFQLQKITLQYFSNF